MYLGEVALAEKSSNLELLFEVKQDHKLLQLVDPSLPLLQSVNVELYGLPLGHEDKAEQIF